MLKVPASKLKAHLGKYVESVKRGVTIIVTDRSVPFGQFGPLQKRSESQDFVLEQEQDPDAIPLTQLPRTSLQGLVNFDSVAWLREDRDGR